MKKLVLAVAGAALCVLATACDYAATEPAMPTVRARFDGSSSDSTDTSRDGTGWIGSGHAASLPTDTTGASTDGGGTIGTGHE